MGMKIEKDQLILPPASELQDGFDLFYQRRSLRKTYQYELEGEQFSLTVCKDQARNVDPCEPDSSNIDDIPAKVYCMSLILRDFVALCGDSGAAN